MNRRVLALGLGLAMTTACASTKPTEARHEVGDILAERGGPRDVVVEDPEAAADDAVRERVQALLAEPLTLDRALQIAVLNNRGLQATMEQLGVAQADLVEAGLLDNPVVGGDLVISTRGNGLGGGLSLSQSLLSAFLIPAKRRLAKAQLRHAVVTVADGTLGLVRDVKVAWVELQAAVAVRDLHRTLVQTAEVADDLAARQIEAGNLSELDRELFAADLDAERLELAEHELEVTLARETIHRLLGLWGSQVRWRIASELPALPETEPELSGLESLGIRQRLDVSAARTQVEAIEYALELRRRGVVPQIDGGAIAGNEVGDDEGHEWVIGPSLSLELPLFDPGHADFARLRSQLRQAQHQLADTAVHARSDIRSQRARLRTAMRQAQYLRDTVLPRREVVGQRALERYNGMLIGTYELLEIRAQQAESQESYVRARRDYWTARAELERAVGGRLPEG